MALEDCQCLLDDPGLTYKAPDSNRGAIRDQGVVRSTKDQTLK